MELYHQYYFFTLFSVVLVASHAANLSPEVYWKVKLPNTLMPKPIKDALHISAAPDNELHKIRQPWGLNLLYQAASENDLHKVRQPWGLNLLYQAASDNKLHKIRQPWGLNLLYQAASENNLHKVRQPWGLNLLYQAASDNELHKIRQPWGLNLLYQATSENDLHKVRQPWGLNLLYQAASENKLHKVHQTWGVGSWYNGVAKNDLVITPFFFETDLHQGKTMNLPSLKNYNPAPFLPRKVVDSIPFSSDKIEEILSRLSIDKDSERAKMIKKTIKMCEDPAENGEVKHCATSLESMVDFTLSHVGTNNIIAMSTEVEKETPEVQTYTIEKVEEKANGKGVVCHKVAYPYAVHYCHDVGRTRAFMVSMVGADGTKVNGVSVCHEDTAPMNPKALPFLLLNVKPGDKPICHFTLDDQIILFPSQNAPLQVAEN